MRKRLVLVVGAIVLGGVGLAVPAIAGAVSGNGPAPVSATPVEAAPVAVPAGQPAVGVPAEQPPVAVPAENPAAVEAWPIGEPPVAVPAEGVPAVGGPTVAGERPGPGVLVTAPPAPAAER